MYNVLIIDDEDQVADVIQRALTRFGYGVKIASGGKEGLEFLKKDDFDVALLDYSMPGISAQSVIDSAKKQDKYPVFVLLTGRADILENNIPRGICASIRKPFDIDDVFRTIQSALSS